MTEKTNAQPVEKRGWLKRKAAAFFEKLFVSLCSYNMGISPAASQEFFYYSGYGCEDAWMYQTMMSGKLVGEEGFDDSSS